TGEISNDGRAPAIRGDDLALAGGEERSATDDADILFVVNPIFAPLPDIAAHIVEAILVRRVTADGRGIGKAVVDARLESSAVLSLVDLVAVIAGVGGRRPFAPPRVDVFDLSRFIFGSPAKFLRQPDGDAPLFIGWPSKSDPS